MDAIALEEGIGNLVIFFRSAGSDPISPVENAVKICKNECKYAFHGTRKRRVCRTYIAQPKLKKNRFS
jgi:hypothetical protein